MQRDSGGSWAGGEGISLGTSGGRGRCSPEGAGDCGLISQARGNLVLACMSFNCHWGLYFSGSASLAGVGKQLGDSRELATLPGALCVLPGSSTLLWSFAAASGKYKMYFFVPHLLGGGINFCLWCWKALSSP